MAVRGRCWKDAKQKVSSSSSCGFEVSRVRSAQYTPERESAPALRRRGELLELGCDEVLSKRHGFRVLQEIVRVRSARFRSDRE